MIPFDSSGEYRPEVKVGEISRLAVRGASITVLCGGLGLGVQVVSTVVLARLLLPRDFGLVALVSTFSLLLMNFGLNGFTEVILQWEKIDHPLVSNLFWINASIGAALMILFAASGRLLGLLYHDPLVPAVTAGMSLTIFLTSLSVQHLALLKKAMRFTTVSANDIFSRFVAVGFSIALARQGWGYRALVAGVVGQALTQTLGAWYLCRWIPGRPRRLAGTSAMVKFALNVYGRFSLNYFTRNVDNLLVGWRFGATPLGLYKKAYDLFALSAGQLSAPLTNVAVAALSRFNPRSEEYKQHLMAGLAVMALVGMGLSGVMTLIGGDLITLLLGPGWAATGKIFTYFGPGVGAIILYYIHGWIHLSIGRADRWLRWGIVEAVATSVCFLVALPWGPVGIAIAWTTSLWLLTLPAFWYALSPIEISVKCAISAVWRFIAAALLAGVGYVWIARGLVAHGWFPGPNDLVSRIALMSLLYSAIYLGIVAAWHPRWPPIPKFSALSTEPESSGEARVSTTNSAVLANADSAADPSFDTSPSGPLVSILMPAYNAQEWIAGTLRSALAQTWENIEIIVVDDESTDRTLEIAKQFESNKKVRVFAQKHQGAAAARNLAFSCSRGDYIQWLDADDFLSPDKIALQIAAAKQCKDKRTVFTCAFGTFKYRHYRANFAQSPLWRDLSPVEWLLTKMSCNVYMQTGTWLISRELSQAVGPWDRRLLGDDDGEYCCRALLKCTRVAFVQGAKAYYRLPNRNSLSFIGCSNVKREAQWTSMQLHIRYLRTMEDSARTRAACVRYLQNWMFLFYPERSEIYHVAHEMARDLGGQIVLPTLAPKYRWFKMLFGRKITERAKVFFPRMKWAAAGVWDKVLYNIDVKILERHGTEPSLERTRQKGRRSSLQVVLPPPLQEPDFQTVQSKDTWG